MDEQDVVVLDTGSGFLKVGFSGEDAPRAVLPTAMATAAADESREDEAAVTGDSAAQKKSQVFYGEEAILQENAQITRPVQRGEIQLTQPEKEAMENLLEHVFRNVLGVEQEDLPCLIADTMPLGQSSYATRQWIAEVMFEKIKVKSLAIFNTAALSLFSTGRTRGLVLESGEGITQAVPVFEGYAIPHAIFKMKVAGHDITQRLQSMMAEELGTKQSHHTMQAMKEKVCFVAPSGSGGVPADAPPDSGDEEARSFELPDGQIIQVKEKIRTGATEILFGGEGEASMQKICLDAINTVDLDFRQDLVKSVVVAGGTSMLLNLAPRLRSELKSTLASELSKTVEVISDSQRRFAAWIGGSMFASLSTFDQVAITKQVWRSLTVYDCVRLSVWAQAVPGGSGSPGFFCVIEQHSAHGPFDIEDIEDLGHSQERAASPRPDLDQHVAEALGPLLPKDELPPKIFGRRGDKASSSVITASQMVI
ncbi:unnamed protein product [Symbiodinium microadriaticum]|nr:unnamed protein product [Symbiodinium microadriaticum]